MIKETERQQEADKPLPKGTVPYPDSVYKRDRDRIRRLFKKWIFNLGLGSWKCDLNHVRGYTASHDGVHTTAASITCDWRYQVLTVEVSLICITDMDDDELEYVIVHELCHAMVNEMREFKDHPKDNAIDHEERVVTCLAKAMQWVHTAGWNEGRADLRRQQKSNHLKTVRDIKAIRRKLERTSKGGKRK